MKNLPVQSLRIEDIKANFKDFLKGNPNYKDFNFEASGISTLLNIQSYQTHYLGWFVKMLLDESFVDSAHTREAMLSHAKRVGYIPKGYRSSSAQVTLKVNTTTAEEPISRSISIPRGATFSASNSAQDKRVFSVLDGTIIYNRTVNGSAVTYTSDPLYIYEGTLETWNFLVDDGLVNQRFIIRDPNIDIDTIRVRVSESASSTDFVEYSLARDVDSMNPSANVFYVSTDEHGNYQIFFGENIVGVQPENGNAIEVTYISTNGPSGDGAKIFSFNGGVPGGDGAVGNYNNFTTETIAVSSGGSNPQSIEDLRFAIPSHYRRQGRIVNAADFRSILLDEYRNIETLNVWGGEESLVRDYGKVYVSIKPKNSDSLTSLARTQIRNSIVKEYGVVGIDVVFVDPEFIEVDVTVNAKIDLRKTNRSLPEVNTLIRDRVLEYNTDYLGRFDNILSDVDFLQYIREGEDEFVTLYDKKVLRKSHRHLHGSSSTNSVVFGNQLRPSTITSSDISYSTYTAYLKDDGLGALNLVDKATEKTLVSAGTVDYLNGVISYNLPVFSRITGYQSSTSGLLEFSAIPEMTDVNTFLNNIVRISKVKVVTG